VAQWVEERNSILAQQNQLFIKQEIINPADLPCRSIVGEKLVLLLAFNS